MDLRQLRYFVAVAEERHFGRAAQRLHMAQPPLSQQIKQLEAALGARLLERTTRKVDLTDAGRLLLDRARQVLADVDALEHDVGEVGRGAAGVLRVGFAGSATYRLMPAIVQLAREALPGVRLQVMGEMLTPHMEQGLLENRLDAAVLRPPVQSADLTLEPVEEDRLLLAVPADHPLAGGPGPVALTTLGGEDLVTYPRDSAVAIVVMEACRQAGFRPRIVQQATETSTLLAFVAAGMGVALVPDGARQAAVAPVSYREITGAPAVGLAVAWKSSGRSPLVPRFLDLTHRAAAQVRGEAHRTANGRGHEDPPTGAHTTQPTHPLNRPEDP